MKKLFLALFICMSTASFAQSGKNQIGVGVDVGLPIGDFADGFGVGIGGSIKGLYGIGNAGQITFTTGYSSFKAKDLQDGVDVNATIVPFLLGYRHNFSGFYVEPQLGYGIYGVKIEGLGDPFDGKESDGAFTYAAGVGYAMAQGLDIGVRYQGASKDGESTSLIGFSVRWNFSLGGSSK